MNWRIPYKPGERSLTGIRLNARSAFPVILLLLAGILPAVAIAVITIWAVASGGIEYVSALVWVAGFVFLALTLDAGSRKAVFFAGTGLALIALACLNSRVAPEFGVLAGFLLAAWAAAPLIAGLGVRHSAPE